MHVLKENNKIVAISKKPFSGSVKVDKNDNDLKKFKKDNKEMLQGQFLLTTEAILALFNIVKYLKDNGTDIGPDGDAWLAEYNEMVDE